MIEWLAERIERLFDLPADRTALLLRRSVAVLSAVTFVLTATVMVSFDEVFYGASLDTLRVGDIAPRDIYATETRSYTSTILTERQRTAASNAVAPVYFPPNPDVAREQLTLAQNILTYISNVRRDIYGSEAQKLNDLAQITALPLSDNFARRILTYDEDTWNRISNEVQNVLERVMRNPITENDLATTLERLPGQVGFAFTRDEADLVVAIVSALVRPNSFPNLEATSERQLAAATSVPEQQLLYQRGQLVVSAGEQIDSITYEALVELDLLRLPEGRGLNILRALVASILVVVVIGLYVVRFQPDLYQSQSRMLALMAVVFMMMLVGARLFGQGDQVFVYPSAALALILVSINTGQLAVFASVGLALLMGLMANNSLETATLVAAGGMMATLALRRVDRLESYFFAGLMIAVVNVIVIAIFDLATISTGALRDFNVILLVLLNGIISAATAIVGLYIITIVFNFPTSLKLIALSRPSQPLLQRLLREAPGTYQHSLQVANLAEQAAIAVGANSELTHVAALYHDIGKMLNPVFFVENQVNIMNPHEALNDPYRSADIIISHVTEGDKLARQYRLPQRVRDFVREHHGTTQVAYFFRKAIDQAGDPAAVDASEFTYPGPKPRTRETGIVMIADSCESTVRARRPATRQEIQEIVHSIIDDRMREGQLDESGLTLGDLKAVQRILVEMLQAVFHPRINYPAASPKQQTLEMPAASVSVPVPESAPPAGEADRKPSEEAGVTAEIPPAVGNTVETSRVTAMRGSETQSVSRVLVLDDDDTPMSEVPPLPRASMTHELKPVKPEPNGAAPDAAAQQTQPDKERPADEQQH